MPHPKQASTQQVKPSWAPIEPTCTTENIEELPAFLRTLLVTDGTVTRALEAFFWEPITVKTLDQHEMRSEQAIPWLAIKPGDTLLSRTAELQGTQSKGIYVRAFSCIKTECIPKKLRNELIAGKIGIGALISESGMESFRELLKISRKPNSDHPHDSNPFTAPKEESNQMVFRTYRIFLNSTPSILITECFPVSMYE